MERKVPREFYREVSMSAAESKFDRTVPDEFLELFIQKEGFKNLVALAKKKGNCLDLQFRALGNRPPHATLYLGTSKAVDIIYYASAKEVTIVPQKSASFADAYESFAKSNRAADKAWGKKQPIEEALNIWNEGGAGTDLIEKLVEAGSPGGQAERYVNPEREGYLQAKVAKETKNFTVIDRESSTSFGSERSKKKALTAARKPVLGALKELRATQEPWTASKIIKPLKPLKFGPKKPSGFGDELDALAVDSQGRILAIEVKGGYDTTGVGWTPAQVAVYKRLFEEWIASDPEAARSALTSMFKQRETLGLGGGQTLPPGKKKLVVVPMILIGEMKSKGSVDTANARMLQVQKVLKNNGESLKGLEVWQAVSGKIKEVGMGGLKVTPQKKP